METEPEPVKAGRAVPSSPCPATGVSFLLPEMATCLFPRNLCLSSPSSCPRSSPSSEKSCAPTWAGSQAKPPPPRSPASPQSPDLLLAQPSALPPLLAQDRRRVCRPPSPLGSRGAADEGKARLAARLGRRPWPRPCMWRGAAALILVTVLRRPEPGPRAALDPQGHPSESGKREEPSPGP